MAGILLLTDGTIQVELKDGPIKLMDWTPAIPSSKNGGIWRNSPLTDGRQMAFRRFDHVTDTFTLGVETDTMDDTIRATRNLRTLLEKAVSYWTAEWQNEPVWITARGSCETETRYALVYDYRTPNDDDPYKPPFHNIPATMDSFVLLLEHGPWLANPPGVGECTSISAQSASEFPYHLEFAGGVATDYVDCLSAAAIDNLPAGAAGFTAEAWIRADGYGGSNTGRIFYKTGWDLRVNSATGLEAVISAPTPATSNSGLDEFTADGLWHHVAMTYNNGGDRFIRLFRDGIQIVSYPTQTAAVGVLTGDAASAMTIGNTGAVAGNARCFDGGIGWCRLSGYVRYALNFTPPPRCVLPAIDGGSVALWICEGTGATAYNKVGTAGTNGAITGALWGSACGELYGREAVCATVGTADTAYVSNKRGGQLSHLFYLDASVPSYSVNLLASALPYNLFPAVMQAAGAGNEDMLYFGSDTTGLQGGPFSNLIFNVGTAANVINTNAWEYWNGAWVAIPAVTASVGSLLFATTGTMIVIFDPPADWIITAIAGCNGYFVRCRLTAVGGLSLSPDEATRDVYTCTSPYSEVSSTAVTGDLAALAALNYFERCTPVAQDITRVVLGWRTIGRGDDFSAYLNLSERGNPFGVDVVAGGGAAAFATSSLAPTGRYINYVPAGFVPIGATIATIYITYNVIANYYGKFRLFVRVAQTGGVVGDFTVRYGLDVGGSIVVGRTVQVLNAGSFLAPCAVDLGPINIGPEEVEAIGAVSPVRLIIQGGNANVAPGTLACLDCILMPADEAVFEAVAKGSYVPDALLDIDSILYPKKMADVSLRNQVNSRIEKKWGYVSSSPLIAPANSNSKLWSLIMSHTAFPGGIFISQQTHLEGTYMEKLERFLSMRGAT